MYSARVSYYDYSLHHNTARHCVGSKTAGHELWEYTDYAKLVTWEDISLLGITPPHHTRIIWGWKAHVVVTDVELGVCPLIENIRYYYKIL